jgi:hypothetical protein
MDIFVSKDADLNSAKAEALANATRAVASYLQVRIFTILSWVAGANSVCQICLPVGFIVRNRIAGYE